MKQFYIYSIIAFMSFSMNAFSQTQLGLGIGIIRSSQEDGTSLLGGEIYAKREITDAVQMGVGIGFYTRSFTTDFGSKVRATYLPISVGGQYLFLKGKFRPFIGLSAGLIGNKVTNIFGIGMNFSSHITPKVGIQYAINEKFGMNANFKYSFVFYRDETTIGPDFFSLISPNLGVYYKL